MLSKAKSCGRIFFWHRAVTSITLYLPMTSLKWWKKICRHRQRKESTYMACSWMALGGIDETAGSRSLPLKFCLLPSLWCTFMRLILPPWLRTPKITQTHWNFMSVLCTRSPDVLTWLTFSAWTWRLHSILITGFFEVLLCCVTPSNVAWHLSAP